MGKRKSVSFGEPQVKEFTKDEVEPKEDAPAKIRRNNRVIENTDFDFGTADQRAENQNFVNEKGTRMKTGLHTIDSDDEEENAQNEKKQKYKKLDIEKVKGLEADTYHDNLDEDGNMITGFNLKDEEEEGEFDSTGQFHFKKRDDRDEWLDTVDWKKIKSKNQDENSKMEEDAKPDEDEKLSEREILEKIVAKMNRKETVTKCLQRLGTGAAASNIPAWKQKRLDKLNKRKASAKGQNSSTAKYEVQEEVSKNEVAQLTNLVDQLSRRGYYDIYTDTYEKIKHKISSMPADDDDVLDMFGDAIDGGKSIAEQATAEVSLADSATKWEYKFKGKDDDIKGPLSTEEMERLKDTHKQAADIFCRRTNSGNTWYSIKRVDFDLW